MTPIKDAYCNFCGTKFPEPLAYPRTCPGCAAQIWANPIPVAVALVPVGDGLLVIRRGIPPGVGKLALVGGFVEDHESWQVGCARELSEEANVAIDPASLRVLWVASTEPRPNRVLIFAVSDPIADLPPFASNSETQERGVIFGAGGLDADFAFPLHAEAARRYFATRGITRDHGFARR
ncbi:MAG TPA: NUDIX domain-containing protein [Kofleriaceae bacterium]|jgi:ADP-ribose pyrophosphatase YjhB (NUDIX family)|nr:NUDIX domain-containing protein [Kofleriaceae bacterium]